MVLLVDFDAPGCFSVPLWIVLPFGTWFVVRTHFITVLWNHYLVIICYLLGKLSIISGSLIVHTYFWKVQLQYFILFIRWYILLLYILLEISLIYVITYLCVLYFYFIGHFEFHFWVPFYIFHFYDFECRLHFWS